MTTNNPHGPGILASVSTTTTTCSLHRRTITIRDPSSDEYYSSQEELPTQHDTGELNNCHSPIPEPEDPGTSVWHIWSAQATDPWGDATHANPDNDPDYPAGSWNPGDRERALAENARDEPVFASDNVYVEDEHIDASPPYITTRALAAPRARNGYHSPTYSRTDPFAALQ